MRDSGRMGRLLLALAAALVLLPYAAQASWIDQYKDWTSGNVQYGDNDTAVFQIKWGNWALMRLKGFYYWGTFKAQLRLTYPQDYTGGATAAFYLITLGTQGGQPDHAELDFEFFKETSSLKTVIHTNIFANAKHKLEQYYQWYNDTQFHEFSIQWNSRFVVWSVDKIPIRITYLNQSDPNEAGAWPRKPLNVQFSLWDSSPSTSNYNNGPATFEIKNVSLTGCYMDNSWQVYDSNVQACINNSSNGTDAPWNMDLGPRYLKYWKFRQNRYTKAQYNWH